eukprot:5162640-Prymnesium_polylepis.1
MIRGHARKRFDLEGEGRACPSHYFPGSTSTTTIVSIVKLCPTCVVTCLRLVFFRSSHKGSTLSPGLNHDSWQLMAIMDHSIEDTPLN